MTAEKPFSFEEYGLIMDKIKDRIVNFKDLKTDNFILLRHDVEFSLDRALEIALIEKQKLRWQLIRRCVNGILLLKTGMR